MATSNAATSDSADADSDSRTNRAASSIADRGRDGSAAILVGGATLAWALKTIRTSRTRATLLVLTGLAAFEIGLRQRRAGSGAAAVETGADARRDEEGRKMVSDDAHIDTEGDLGAGRKADESAGAYQSGSEPNPRGVADGADAQADEGGDVDFVEGTEPGTRETHLEDDRAHDPRLHPDTDDERTAVDLSAAAMADEASEATGPHPEQSYPAREGTDPEPTTEEAPEWVEGEGSDAEERPAGEETGGESEETSNRPER